MYMCTFVHTVYTTSVHEFILYLVVHIHIIYVATYDIYICGMQMQSGIISIRKKCRSAERL